MFLLTEQTLEALDLSGKKIKKLTKPTAQESQINVLILDDNELQRLDNIDSYVKLQKVFIWRFRRCLRVLTWAISAIGCEKSAPTHVRRVPIAFVAYVKFSA